jgi:hypothetical protein
MFEFSGRILRSHPGHVLLAISWTFILLVFVHPRMTQTQFVDCVPGDAEFSTTEILRTYPIWTTALGVCHLPSLLLTQMSTMLLQRLLSLSCGPTAKVEMALLFGFSAIQWLLLGYIIESLFRRRRHCG